jgi:transcriptional regulator with XRE-family HTH domain
MTIDDAERQRIIEAIRTYMARERISREEFAQRAKLGKSTIDKLATGLFSERTILQIEARLKIKLRDAGASNVLVFQEFRRLRIRTAILPGGGRHPGLPRGDHLGPSRPSERPFGGPPNRSAQGLGKKSANEATTCPAEKPASVGTECSCPGENGKQIQGLIER